MAPLDPEPVAPLEPDPALPLVDELEEELEPVTC